MHALILVLSLPCLALGLLAPAGAEEKIPLGRAVGGLALGARLAAGKVAPGKPVILEVELRNLGQRPLVVRSHVQADERHYDWLAVSLRFPTPSREGCRPRFSGKGEQRIGLVDNREKSAPIAVTLKPGEQVRHAIDLAAWAARPVNRRKGIAPGFYKVVVGYQVKGDPGVWTGTLEAPSLRLVVEGKPPPGRCASNPGWDTF